ncbi:hypothetical protein PMAYCL1PPCAC_21616, partial [Pristionchus mayeri]
MSDIEFLSDNDISDDEMSEASDPEEDTTPKDPALDRVVLDQSALQKDMDAMIAEVSQIVQISAGAARILLQHYKWDTSNLLERFYECSNVEKFLQAARVLPDPTKLGDGVDGKMDECSVCCCDAVLKGIACRHYFCDHCWAQYLTTKVTVTNTSMIECPYPGCKLLVDDEHVHSLIGSDRSSRNTFARLSIEAYVTSNQKLRWCPGVGCGKAVKISQRESKEVECSCKRRFCFECGDEGHQPMSCGLSKRWIQKCKDDSETSNW